MLVIAKLDRLSRNASFVTALQRRGRWFIAACMPAANETTVDLWHIAPWPRQKAISQLQDKGRSGSAEGTRKEARRGPWRIH